MDKKKIIITVHNSKFHADDVFSVATLFLLFEKEYDISVVRTRDQKIIDESDYAVDVGDSYDPEKNRFDHHQIGGAGKRENGIPYASFGLVWKKFGEELCGSNIVAEKIDLALVQGIDATDNGIEISKATFPDVYMYDIGDFVDMFTPTWKESGETLDQTFLEVVSYAKMILLREIKRYTDKMEAREKVIEVYKQSSDKRIIIFDRTYPADEFLSEFPEPVFKIAPKDDGTWMVTAINSGKYSFASRKLLPEKWAGKRDTELQEVTGIPEAIFCHNGRFIAVTQTKDSAIRMAQMALEA
ncbi:MAG: MYG1 family protein [bacterium]